MRMMGPMPNRACHCDECPTCAAHWAAEEAAYQALSASIRETNEAKRVAAEEAALAARPWTLVVL